MEHIIGKYATGEKGALLIVTAGIHGNEPSGIAALQRVFFELERQKPEISGKILGLRGNIPALEKNTRFIEEDLNRIWTDKNLSAPENTSIETKEMNEMISVMEMDENEGFSKYYFVDCHSTSSERIPFISAENFGENEAWAKRFPFFIVKGFGPLVNGALDIYLSEQGMTGFTFEAGQHLGKNTVQNQEAVIWLALKEACGLDLEKMDNFPECIGVLDEYPGQKTFEIVYRHGLDENDDFKMKPGFANFQKIAKGEVLAEQNGREIHSEWNARIFMPLYQEQGNDGFFVVQESF